MNGEAGFVIKHKDTVTDLAKKKYKCISAIWKMAYTRLDEQTQ